jgi:hypothetical protein
MKLFNRSKFLAGAALTALIVAASPIAVYAQHGEDDASDTTTSSSTSVEPNSTVSTTSESSDDNFAAEQELKTGRSTVRERAQQLLGERRQKGKEHSEAQRQRACQNHEDGINHLFESLGTKADRFLQRYDGVFTKVQAFQDKNQLDVSTYDDLVADVTAKQTTATAAVAALKDLSGTKIDCTAADPAASVASVRTATQDARSALQAYRLSLKKLVKALIDANGPSPKSSPKATERLDQSGSHVVAVVLLVLVLGVIGFAGYTVMQRDKKTSDTTTNTTADMPAAINSKADLNTTAQSLDSDASNLNGGVDGSTLDSSMDALL